MQGKNAAAPRRVVSKADVEAAAKSLAVAVDRLTRRNEAMKAYLSGEKDDPLARVANSPVVSLEDATERARKYWDKLEGKRRSSVPPVESSAKKEGRGTRSSSRE